jgi:hypothetical protein
MESHAAGCQPLIDFSQQLTLDNPDILHKPASCFKYLFFFPPALWHRF